MNDRRIIYVLKLRALPGVDAIRALRHVLKRLLRQYGLRCVSVSEEQTDQQTEN
jgi:hypothetical protein